MISKVFFPAVCACVCVCLSGEAWFPGLWTTGVSRSSSEAVKAPGAVKRHKLRAQNWNRVLFQRDSLCDEHEGPFVKV